MSQDIPNHHHLFSDAKVKLADRINGNINNCGSLVRQVLRGSKTNDVRLFLTNEFNLAVIMSPAYVSVS